MSPHFPAPTSSAFAGASPLQVNPAWSIPQSCLAWVREEVGKEGRVKRKVHKEEADALLSCASLRFMTASGKDFTAEKGCKL